MTSYNLNEAGYILSNLLANLVELYEILGSMWAGYEVLVGWYVVENQSSFDFKGACSIVVQHI